MSMCRPTNRANAALVEIIMAEDPEMPAPAGDSECDSNRNPCFGWKKRTRYAARACRYFLAAIRAARLGKWSSRPVSRDFRWISRPLRGVILHVVRILTAMLTVTDPGWKRYRGQRSRVEPARSARHGAWAKI